MNETVDFIVARALVGNILRRMRWDDQGGYPGRHNGKWTFYSTSMTQITAEELDQLFAFAGIVPDEIVPRGRCQDCVHAKTYPMGERAERGYEPPCVSCKRPIMSNFEAVRA